MTTLNGTELFEALEDWRKKQDMTVTSIAQKIGIARSMYYRLKSHNNRLEETRQIKAVELLGLTETELNPHILRINGHIVHPGHDRLLHSEPASEMIMALFQRNPKNETITDLSIAFQTQEHVITGIIKDYEHNKPYNLKFKA